MFPPGGGGKGGGNGNAVARKVIHPERLFPRLRGPLKAALPRGGLHWGEQG